MQQTFDSTRDALALLPNKPHRDGGQAAPQDHATLAMRQTIAELVSVYGAAVQDIRRSFRTLADVEQRLNDAFSPNSYRTLRVGSSDRLPVRYDDPDRAIKKLEREVWRTLVDRLDVRRMMSVTAWTQLERQLQEDELPELTTDNALGMVQGFVQRLPDMLAEAVEEVFDFLRPRGSAYKTNTEYEVGRKVILSGVVEARWLGDGFEVHYHRQQRLTALENVFSALDGQGAINKAYFSELSNAIKESGKSGRGETPYFRFRCFKNGNLHLEFKRLDLLQQLNAIAGGKRLRGAK